MNENNNLLVKQCMEEKLIFYPTPPRDSNINEITIEFAIRPHHSPTVDALATALKTRLVGGMTDG